MAGAACKVIINGGRGAIADALERILIEPELNGGRIYDKERKEMLQQMADIDRVAYHGGTVQVSYVDIMVRLEDMGVLSPDVWNIYARPNQEPEENGSRKPKRRNSEEARKDDHEED